MKMDFILRSTPPRFSIPIVVNFYNMTILVAVALAGCSSTGMHTAQMDESAARLAQIQEREAAVTTQAEQVASRESQLAQQQRRLDLQLKEAQAAEARALAARPASTPSSMDQSLLPPKASPGECFARVFVSPTYETVTQKMLRQESSERIEIIPAKYATVTEQVMIEAASERLESIPAKYAMVDEKLLVKPASSRLVTVPARYAKTSEKMLVRSAHQEWKKGTGPIQRVDEATGEIMCLVDIPAEYRTVTKTVTNDSMFNFFNPPDGESFNKLILHHYVPMPLIP